MRAMSSSTSSFLERFAALRPGPTTGADGAALAADIDEIAELPTPSGAVYIGPLSGENGADGVVVAVPMGGVRVLATRGRAAGRAPELLALSFALAGDTEGRRGRIPAGSYFSATPGEVPVVASSGLHGPIVVCDAGLRDMHRDGVFDWDGWARDAVPGQLDATVHPDGGCAAATFPGRDDYLIALDESRRTTLECAVFAELDGRGEPIVLHVALLGPLRAAEHQAEAQGQVAGGDGAVGAQPWTRSGASAYDPDGRHAGLAAGGAPLGVAGAMGVGVAGDGGLGPALPGGLAPGADQLGAAAQRIASAGPGPVDPAQGAAQHGGAQHGSAQMGPVQPGAVQTGAVQAGAAQPLAVQAGFAAGHPGPPQLGQPGAFSGAAQTAPGQDGALTAGLGFGRAPAPLADRIRQAYAMLDEDDLDRAIGTLHEVLRELDGGVDDPDARAALAEREFTPATLADLVCDLELESHRDEQARMTLRRALAAPTLAQAPLEAVHLAKRLGELELAADRLPEAVAALELGRGHAQGFLRGADPADREAVEFAANYEAQMTFLLADARLRAGEHAAAADLAGRATQRFGELERDAFGGRAALLAANAHRATGQDQLRRASLQEAERLFRRGERHDGLGIALGYLAYEDAQRGDYRPAVAKLIEARDELERAGLLEDAATASDSLALCFERMGERHAASEARRAGTLLRGRALEQPAGAVR